MTFNPRNILVIDFGQLGDVVMSLPALRAIRARFPHALITVAVGRPAAQIIDMSGYADGTIEVDRVELRDGFKPLSILRIFQTSRPSRIGRSLPREGWPVAWHWRCLLIQSLSL